MPIPSPFHTRASELSQGQEWRDWSGYLSASLYEPVHEREYYAIRNAAAMIDVSPLYKYEVRGPDAARLLDRVLTRDVRRCQVGQVLYSPWCDDGGKVIDDGTVSRLEADLFRVTAAETNLTWFQDAAIGMDVEVRDISTSLAALALQGPNSRRILELTLGGIDLASLKYYHVAPARLGEHSLTVSRTGYTGDLGYELWIAPEQALGLWDALMERGEAYGLAPAGIVALDIARIEAGLIMLAIDYISSRKAYIESQKSSPYEIGLGWAVDLRKPAFIGRKALLSEKEQGSMWKLVGLEVDWKSLEALYTRYGLAPRLAGRASRLAVPVYQGERQVGQLTSHTFSPLLKKYIGIGTLESKAAAPGSAVGVEFTVEYARHKVAARLVELPFFNPSRKKA